jgi:hypothetical protein
MRRLIQPLEQIPLTLEEKGMDYVDMDMNVNWLKWNGCAYDSEKKARAQTMHILLVNQYQTLGSSVYRNILDFVRM